MKSFSYPDSRKVAIVGTGMVGMSYAYAMLNQGACDELVLIDINRERAKGEAMDLNHGVPFAQSNMRISEGDYEDCRDADIVVISAGVAQKEGETRLDLLQRNANVLKSVTKGIMESGFMGIIVVATNPVDIMTRVVQEYSGFNSKRVIGTGTILDTARLRYMVGDYFSVDPRNIHGYVMGEHGDSEFVPWSQAFLATKRVLDICSGDNQYCVSDLEKISEQVRTSAYTIIKAKNATYYGIGMSMVRLTKAILGNENSVLTVSAKLTGEYGQNGVYTGVPCIIGRSGIMEILEIDMTEEEMEKLNSSCKTLIDFYGEINK
ncbi:MAG: L-lactate dehydrogenase [Clostridia bacterium]|nr:L-lactate dehydrogenase [Clostridia bacterium]